MLVELEIEDLAVIRRARLPFGPGLNALTGATGAGKSLVLRALELVRGARATKADGACSVQALFRLDAPLDEATLAALGPIAAEDDELVVARRIAPDGRSRAWINGRIAPLSALRALGERLVDVLGQGDARRLETAAERSALVDAFGGTSALAKAYADARAAARAAADRRDRLHEAARERRRRLEFLRYERAEVDATAVRPGELAELEGEHGILEAAAQLRDVSGDAIASLYEDDDSIVDRLAAIERRAADLGDEAAALLAPAAEALARARSEIDEAVASFRHALERVDVEPGRLGAVRERLDAVRRLLDRFGPTEEALLAHRVAADLEIRALEADEDDEAEADRRVDEADRALEAAAEALDRARAGAARRLAKAAVRELVALGMEEARFRAVLSPYPGETIRDRAHADGASRVEFLLAANAGHAERPIAEVASGGETARIALALRRVAAAARDVPVLVFDEIDSGIGARLGEAVARCLRGIAADRQVVVVTHLPQVAAFAARHLRVEKAGGTKRTEASVVLLDGEDREREIAEMMRGADAAGTTRREARELLSRAGESS